MGERTAREALRIDLRLLYDKLTGKVNEVNSRMSLLRKRNLNGGKLEKKVEIVTLRIEEKESALSSIRRDVERVRLKGGNSYDLIGLAKNLNRVSEELGALHIAKRARLDLFLQRQREVVENTRAQERLNENTEVLLRSKEQLEEYAQALTEPIQLMTELRNEEEVKAELLRELAGLRALSSARTREINIKKQQIASYKATLQGEIIENSKIKAEYQGKYAEFQARGQGVTEFSTNCTILISQLNSQLESTELNLETIQDSIDLVGYTIQQTMRNNI